MKENSLNIKEVKGISCCVWPSLGWVLRLQEVKFLGRTDTSNSWSKGIPGVGVIGGEPLNFTWYNNLITQLHKRQKAAGASGWIQDFPACKHKCYSVCMPMHACICNFTPQKGFSTGLARNTHWINDSWLEFPTSPKVGPQPCFLPL